MKVACLMMQKNEGRTLDTWIKYHADLFGIDNLFIFDNGSTDQETIEILSAAREKSAHINFDCNTFMHFEKKGDIFRTNVHKIEKLQQGYEFFLFLDCDEFVVAVNDAGSIDLSDGAVLRVLQALPRNGSAKYVRGALNNHPTEVDKFFFKHERKSFFEAGTLESLDIGFHYGKSINGLSETVNNIVFLHFHNRPYASLLRAARQKLRGRVKTFTQEGLNDLVARKGRGHHLVRYFLSSEADYMATFDDTRLQWRRAEFKAYLNRIGADYPHQKDLDEALSKPGPSDVIGLEYLLD